MAIVIAAVVGYLIGAMATFRNRFLKNTEEAERSYDTCSRCRRDTYGRAHSDGWHMEGRNSVSGVQALLWPAYWTVLLAWKAMFPRGTKTRYTKQKEQAAKLQEDMANLKKQADALGLKLPEGFDGQVSE